MFRSLVLAALLFVSTVVFPVLAQTPEPSPPTLDWYLDPPIFPDLTHDDAIAKPSATLGYEVGEWHVRHDQVVHYAERLAASSDRVVLQDYARSHEQRRLFHLVISSPLNLRHLDDIRRRHLRRLSGDDDDTDDEPLADQPIVVCLGYSVHGNESSGANAALLVAWHLAAAQGKAIDDLLARCVILIDPCLNPDGLSRFAQWANMHKGRRLNADRLHREHREAWPNGRTNHYWFDLNRDWLLLRHPESRGRIDRFHEWRPTVVTDVHEMGTDATYFFQPGVRARHNPLIPRRNYELTGKIAAYHGAALDRIGSLYYTGEQFDDFYFGKGSTYPDAHGSIGILFEQGSSRGHLQESIHGDVSFPFTIRNQLRTSLSTLKAVSEMRTELLAYQRECGKTARFEAAADSAKAWVFGDADDPVRTAEMVELLRRHRIDVHCLGRDLAPHATDDGTAASSPSATARFDFAVASSFIVPANQPQYRLAKALFERRTTFTDNTFYDVSAWTLPLAFAMPFRELGAAEYDVKLLGEKVVERRPKVSPSSPKTDEPVPDASAVTVGWALDWRRSDAPHVLGAALRAGHTARVATKAFSATTATGVRRFDAGSVVLSASIEKVADLAALVAEHDDGNGSQLLHRITSGMATDGIDLGSPSLQPVRHPKVLLAAGKGVSTYEAGEVWHLLDHRFDIDCSVVELDDFDGLDFSRYTVLVMVNGKYGSWDDDTIAALGRWVESGGTVIATKSATEWVQHDLMGQNLTAPKKPSTSASTSTQASSAAEKKKSPTLTYAEQGRHRAEHRIGGAIFDSRIDVTHPLGYGYARRWLPIFRNSTRVLPEPSDPVTAVVRYTTSPLMAGYASDRNVRRVAGTPAVVAEKFGRGTVIRMVDNPNFRAYWLGTTRMFLNAIYFGSAIRAGGAGEDGHQH